jgi:GAF domain-containing protein
MDQEQFDKYQHFTEKTIYDLSQKVIELENKLNVITNLLEVSKYINKYIKDPNLFSIINDMIVGVFGAKYSTIYIAGKEGLGAAARNMNYSFTEEEKQLILAHNQEEFIIHSETPVYADKSEEESVYSVLGVPIKVEDRLLGFIAIQHKEMNYFTGYHMRFLSSISNHIGVAIENSILQKQISQAN